MIPAILASADSVEKWASAHADLIDLLALIALLINLAFMAWQSKSLKDQTGSLTSQALHSAAIARADSLRNSVLHLHQVETVFIDRPNLRPYFHDGKELPTDRDIRAQALTIAGSLADCLDSAILQAESFARDDVDDWRENARVYLHNSPVLRTVVKEHTNWWPDVAAELSTWPTPNHRED